MDRLLDCFVQAFGINRHQIIPLKLAYQSIPEWDLGTIGSVTRSANFPRTSRYFLQSQAAHALQSAVVTRLPA